MIVRRLSRGHGADGAVQYITHDEPTDDNPRPRTHDRVGDRVAFRGAVDYNPRRDREEQLERMGRILQSPIADAQTLKRLAKRSTRGRKPKHGISHFSLSWPKGEAPNWETMVAAGDSFMKKVGLQNRRAVYAGHVEEGKPSHLHIVVCDVDPDTGMMFTGDAVMRGSRWAQEWEQKQYRPEIQARIHRNEARDRARDEVKRAKPEERRQIWRRHRHEMNRNHPIEPTRGRGHGQQRPVTVQEQAEWGATLPRQRAARRAAAATPARTRADRTARATNMAALEQQHRDERHALAAKQEERRGRQKAAREKGTVFARVRSVVSFVLFGTRKSSAAADAEARWKTRASARIERACARDPHLKPISRRLLEEPAGARWRSAAGSATRVQEVTDIVRAWTTKRPRTADAAEDHFRSRVEALVVDVVAEKIDRSYESKHLTAIDENRIVRLLATVGFSSQIVERDQAITAVAVLRSAKNPYTEPRWDGRPAEIASKCRDLLAWTRLNLTTAEPDVLDGRSADRKRPRPTWPFPPPPEAEAGKEKPPPPPLTSEGVTTWLPPITAAPTCAADRPSATAGQAAAPAAQERPTRTNERTRQQERNAPERAAGTRQHHPTEQPASPATPRPAEPKPGPASVRHDDGGNSGATAPLVLDGHAQPQPRPPAAGPAPITPSAGHRSRGG